MTSFIGRLPVQLLVVNHDVMQHRRHNLGGWGLGHALKPRQPAGGAVVERDNIAIVSSPHGLSYQIRAIA